MNIFKRSLAAILCVVMVVGITGCGGSSGSSAAATSQADAGQPAAGGQSQATPPPADATFRDQIVVATPLDVTTTDPQGSNTDANMMIFILTHETLVELDPATGEVIPGLAEFEAVDSQTFKFTLPANAAFTDGTPCTAKDVVFTYNRAKDSSFTAPKVSLITSVEAVSEQEVIIKISQPSQEFLMSLAHKSLSILSEKAITEKGDEGSNMGTGMYQLENWVPGDYISVVRNESYRGEVAKTRRIEFRLMKEDSARVIALQTGEIDVCIDLPTVELDYVANDSNLELVQVPNVIMLYLAMNINQAPFDNQLVRQAMAHAINKESFIAVGYNNLGSPHNNMLNRGQFGLDESLTGYEYDLEKAKALLAEAGYPDGFTFELAYNGSAKNLMAQVFQADLAKIGITADLQEMESAALKSMLNEKTHVTALYQWTDADGSDFTVRSMFYSGSGSNRSLIADPVLDKMIDEALVEPDAAKRKTMYHEIERYVTDVCPVVPICTSILNIGTKADVEGVVWMGTAKHDYRGIYMIES